jgi:hypothetical protein
LLVLLSLLLLLLVLLSLLLLLLVLLSLLLLSLLLLLLVLLSLLLLDVQLPLGFMGPAQTPSPFPPWTSESTCVRFPALSTE